jgi:citrate/tricarballylate utilization protein
MTTLEGLIHDARELAQGQTSVAESEAVRQLQICNACRYCEGFCAMFPAMTRRLAFPQADVHYLANLCHNCGACLHACQYAPPHDFAVNIPQAMARVRGQTYAQYAWPAPLGALYQRNGLTLSLALAIALALFLWLGWSHLGHPAFDPAQGFYALFPHNQLVALFAPVFVFGVLALGLGVRRFLRDITPATTGAALSPAAGQEAAHAALTLRYLDGGHGQGCNNADDAFTHARRHAHHLTFYGFLLCFAATSVATIYHYAFGWVAPYAWPSLPKLLGVTGGISLALGSAALLVLHLKRHPAHGDATQKPMDLGFIALLLLISVSGLGLWLAKGHSSLPWWLCVHLGSVMAFFATLPYSKMAHGFYRSAALLRDAVEKRQPNTLGLGSD